MQKFSRKLFCLIFVFLSSSCGYKNKENTQYFCKELSLNCNIKEKILIFNTSKGIVKVQLFADSHPITVANFISKVKSNTYSNKYFYKIISYPNSKLIHNGLGKISDFGQTQINGVNNGSIPLEIKLIDKKPIYNIPILDPFEIRNLEHKFEDGSLSMVKINENSSSSTEFFFSLNKLPEFDGRYSIFGRVISGLEILDNLDKNDLIKNIEFY